MKIRLSTILELINFRYIASLFKRAPKRDRDDVMVDVLGGSTLKSTTNQNDFSAEVPYDFAVRCVSCGQLMPKEHLMTNMGKCAKCSEKKFNDEFSVFLGRCILSIVAALVLITIVLLIFRVGLKEKMPQYEEIFAIGNLFKGNAIVALSAMAVLFVPLKNLAIERITDSKPSFIVFVIALAYLAMFMLMLNTYIVVIILDVLMWIALAGVMSYLIFLRYRRYELLKSFRLDTIEFNAKIIRLEREKRANGEDVATQTEQKAEVNAEDVAAPAPQRKKVAPITFAAPSLQAEETKAAKRPVVPKVEAPEPYAYYKVAVEKVVAEPSVKEEAKPSEVENKLQDDGNGGDFMI